MKPASYVRQAIPGSPAESLSKSNYCLAMHSVQTTERHLLVENVLTSDSVISTGIPPLSGNWIAELGRMRLSSPPSRGAVRFPTVNRAPHQCLRLYIL